MLFAGATVIVALLGLFVLGVSFLNGVAVASAIVVLVTMTAAVTLIPALLGMFGMRVLSRKERRRLEARRSARPEARRLLAALGEDRAGPSLAARRRRADRHARARRSRRCRCGSAPPTPGQDPASSTTRKAYDLLAKGFGPGFNGTFQIVARTPNGKADLPKVQQLADDAEQDRRPGRGRARRCRARTARSR